VGRLRIRKKYLRIKEDTYELLCNILTFLLKKSRNVGLIKKKDRNEREFRAFNKIIPFYNILGKLLIILFIFRSRIF
jgi:hypothetical protein